MTRIACLTALVACAALPVTALAQTNVTMYGIADAGIVLADPDAPGYGTALRVDTSIMSTSRWGIRGIEDLGGGLSAFFNAEANWALDVGQGDPGATGTGGLSFARRSVVGLQGGFGQFYLGREYTPSFYSGLATDLFGMGLNGTTLAWAADGILPVRFSNGIYYNTPNWNGFQVRTAIGKLALAGSEYFTASRKRDTTADVALMYNKGAWLGNVYYRWGYANVAETDAARFSPPKVRQYGGGAGYKFGIARVVAGFAVSDPTDAATIRDKVVAWNLGVGIGVGAGEVLIQGHQVRYKNETTGDKPRADTLGLAYTYPLSKRSTLYASYAMTRNKDGANLSVRNNSNAYGGSTIGADGVNTSPRVLALGIRHSF